MLHVKAFRHPFVERCVKSRVPPSERFFDSGPPIPYDKRWGTTIIAMHYLMERRDCIVLAWDLQVYGYSRRALPVLDGRGQAKRALDLAVIDQAITSLYFWEYMGMCCALHGMMADATAWCEACPCHRSVHAAGRSIRT